MRVCGKLAVAACLVGAVKPAFEDVNAGGFLAFPPAMLMTKSKPSRFLGVYK
jgi:hypothetical protein